MSDLYPPSHNLLAVFNSLPGAYLLLSRELIIEAASDAYLEATLTKREDIIGVTIFQAFPDNPETPEAKGTTNLRASLEQVLATGKSHEMARQHYDVPDPERSGYFIERHWLPLNSPVLDAQGQVYQIIHSVINVTEAVVAEKKLHLSQSREQAAHAQANFQEQQLHDILMQAPALICIFQGPKHVFKLVNPLYQQLVGERPLLGKPLAQAMPELVGQSFLGLLDEVYRTGKPFYAHEMQMQLDHQQAAGELRQNYYNFIYQATRNLAGEIDGIMMFANEVTPQVEARRQVEISRQEVQNLNEELQVINEELQATNQELTSTNEELAQAQQALQELNNNLEALVVERTQALRQALWETEQQREQLREQQNKLQQILGQVPANIATLVGPEHRYSFFNDSYQALSGNRASLGLTVAEVLPEVVEQGFVALLDQVYATGVPFRGTETPAQLYDPNTEKPEQRYIDFIYQPLLDESGEIQGILAFIVDVTEKVEVRQRAAALQTELLANAQKLIQERETFYQVFEMTPAAICIQRGPEHRYEYFNAAYQAFFPGRQLLGLTVAEALPETVPAGFAGLLDKVYQTGETYYGYESPLLLEQPDGKPPRTIYFTFTYQAYRENGQIVGISTFAYDVTQQVRNRQKMEESTQQLRMITDALPVLIGYLDQEEKYRFANQAYESWFNQKPENLLGRPVREVVGETAYRGVKKYIDRALGGERLDFEATMPYRADFSKHIRTSYIPNWQNDKIAGFYTLVQDVTDQVEARMAMEVSERQATALAENLLKTNEELNQANQQLLRVNADLDNFIYTASHDLKAPILNIEGLVEALQEQLAPETLQDEEVQYTLHLMQNSVQRFKRTISHLTEVTKLQKENSTEAIPVDLVTLFTDVQLDLATLIQATHAQIEVDVSGCPTIRFSAKNLRSIVYNLLSNAIKYHSPARTPLIKIHCSVTAEYQILTFVDNGLGMNLTGKSKLFTMFNRFHNHVEGSGIGLYMVKKIMDNAGGKIEVQSTVGQGSTFQIYFRRNKEGGLNQ